jgi:hypothetical protein
MNMILVIFVSKENSPGGIAFFSRRGDATQITPCQIRRIYLTLTIPASVMTRILNMGTITRIPIFAHASLPIAIILILTKT